MKDEERQKWPPARVSSACGGDSAQGSNHTNCAINTERKVVESSIGDAFQYLELQVGVVRGESATHESGDDGVHPQPLRTEPRHSGTFVVVRLQRHICSGIFTVVYL
jgi:hypothetical protein